MQAVFRGPPGSNGTVTPTDSCLDWTSIKPEDQTLVHQVALPYHAPPCLVAYVNASVHKLFGRHLWADL